MSRSTDWNLTKGAWSLLDLAVAGCSAALVPLYWSPLSETLRAVSIERLVFYALFYGFAFLVAGEVLGVHERRSSHSWRFRTVACALAACGACLALLLVVWAVEYRFVGRFALAKVGGCSVGGVMLLRMTIERMASRNRPKVAALVSEEAEKELARAVEVGAAPVALVKRGLAGSETAGEAEGEEGKDGEPESLAEWCGKRGVSEVLTQRDLEGKGGVEVLSVVPLLAAGIRVSDLVDFWERTFERIPAQYVDEAWLARLDLRMRHPVFHRAKRCLDVAVSVVGLLLTAPLLCAAWFAIRLESSGSALFSQTRTGFLGSEYVLFKLRTMRQDAEDKGARWAKEEDDRVTRVGRFLRKWRIDEIPQFWNVLRGEMSVVGPRPERPEFVKRLGEEIPVWSCRHLVKPGLTGWAQIRFRYAGDADASREKLSYDLYYLKNASLVLDLQIILSTLRSVAKGSR